MSKPLTDWEWTILRQAEARGVVRFESDHIARTIIALRKRGLLELVIDPSSTAHALTEAGRAALRAHTPPPDAA